MNYWLVLPLNPEPWRVGPVGVTRKNGLRGFVGKDAQLEAYKEAVREAAEYDLREQGIDPESVMLEGSVELHLYFWRRQDSYESTASGKQVRKHQVDLTNMVKATEDALIGLFYKDDKTVAIQHNHIMSQDFTTYPMVVIGVRECAPPTLVELPSDTLRRVLDVSTNSEPSPALFDSTVETDPVAR